MPDVRDAVAQSQTGNELNGDDKYEFQRCHDAGDGKYQDAFTVKSMTTLPSVLAIHARRQALGPPNSKGELTTAKTANGVILPSELTSTVDGTEVRYDLQSAAYHCGTETNAQDRRHYYAEATHGSQRIDVSVACCVACGARRQSLRCRAGRCCVGRHSPTTVTPPG